MVLRITSASGAPGFPREKAGPEVERAAIVVLDSLEGPGEDLRDSRSLVSLREPAPRQGIDDGGTHPGGGERPASGREVAVKSQSGTVAEPFLGIGEQCEEAAGGLFRDLLPLGQEKRGDVPQPGVRVPEPAVDPRQGRGLGSFKEREERGRRLEVACLDQAVAARRPRPREPQTAGASMIVKRRQSSSAAVLVDQRGPEAWHVGRQGQLALEVVDDRSQDERERRPLELPARPPAAGGRRVRERAPDPQGGGERRAGLAAVEAGERQAGPGLAPGPPNREYARRSGSREIAQRDRWTSSRPASSSSIRLR